MARSINTFIIVLLIICISSGCANMKEINSFAVTSQQVMQKNRTVSFGYYDYYHDSAYIYNSMPDHLRDVDCNCDAEKKADTVLTNECDILSSYFTALALFTDPKSAIAVDPLAKSFSSGTYGKITISSQESGIASGLATGLSDIFTTGYKSKKLKPFLAIYKDSVAPLISLLKIRADNFSRKIINLQLTLNRVADSLISYTANKEVKFPLLFAYEQKKKQLEEIVVMYQNRENDFAKLSTAGELINENMNDLTSTTFKQKMKVLVSDLSLHAHQK